MQVNIKKISIVEKKYYDLLGYKEKDDEYNKVKKIDYKLAKVVLTISDLIYNNDSVIIAIDGMSGSGKTTFANQLKMIFNANVFHIDDFFQKSIIKNNNQSSKYGSNINFEKINETIIEQLKSKKSVNYQLFDFKKHEHTDIITVNYKPINIIEGSYSHHPEISYAFDYKIYFKTNKFKQLYRIIKRNGFKKSLKFIKTWIPNENKYNKKLKIQNKANIVVKV